MNVALITGANRGIGLELTRQCLQRGDRVFATCRNPQDAVELQALEAGFEQLTILQMDVTRPISLHAARQSVEAQVPSLNLLFNNAGIGSGGETITSVRLEDMLQALEVNAIGPVMVVKEFYDLLRVGRSPRVVNISSEAGSLARARSGRGYSYFGSKAALNMYTRALAFDRNMRGIIVIALHPGWVRTDIGGSMAPLSPAEAVESILQVADSLTEADTGKFFTYDGREHPW
jgi:NAD(P)-dependent dehydrogenase (short-subunit alcohol dehydrogenase family)